MDDFRLTSKQITRLKLLHRTLRDRKLAYRVNAIVLLGTGWSVTQVAEVLLVDETTVRNWLEKYRQGGETGLLAVHYQGKEPSLTDEQQEQLAQHLDENTYFDSNAIRHHIETTYGVKYKPSGVKDLLHRLGFVYKKPKHVPGKLDPNAKVIHVIIDNAKYYKSKLVKERLKGSKIKLHFLPGYSPKTSTSIKQLDRNYKMASGYSARWNPQLADCLGRSYQN